MRRSSRARTAGWTKAIEHFQALRNAPHQGAELAAVDVAAGIQDAIAELPHDGVIGFGARQHYFVAQFVGFDKMATELSQGMAHEAFAATPNHRLNLRGAYVLNGT